ncbi:MAG: hypothetical protein Q7T79_03055 [bacterium]|nr:hypothetical protein [bacterium]
MDNETKYFIWLVWGFIIITCILGLCGIYKDDYYVPADQDSLYTDNYDF